MEEEQKTGASDETTNIQQETEVMTPTDTSQAEAPAPQKPKRTFKHKKLVLLLVATALIVGGASASATYYLVSKDKDTANSVDTIAASGKLSANFTMRRRLRDSKPQPNSFANCWPN